jgi:signal transduction histidine kinase
MSIIDRYRALEQEFLATVIGELMPGILHNFANPLNGIMGRSKLLQRRLEDVIGKIERQYPLVGQEMEQDKIMRDISTIVSEVDRFYTIFRGLADKFTLLASQELDRINIAHLIDMELRFADFYLDFKHECKKNLQIDHHVPDFIGNSSVYSFCFAALLRSAKDRMQDCEEKQISLTTGHDDTCITVTVSDTGTAISEACIRVVEDRREQDLTFLPRSDRGLYFSLLCLQELGVGLQVRSELGSNMVVLSIPYP